MSEHSTLRASHAWMADLGKQRRRWPLIRMRGLRKHARLGVLSQVAQNLQIARMSAISRSDGEI
jgi:hypothetical protein